MRTAPGWFIAAALSFVVLATACGSKSAAPAGGAFNGDANHGKQLFLETCATCHGPDAKGLPGAGKNLVASTFIKGKTDPELLAFIQQGRSPSDPLNTTGVQMPPRGGNPSLKDADLKDIIAFIRTVNAGQ